MVRLAARVWRFFQSRNLSLVLLAIVTCGVIVASLIPQQGHVSPRSQAGDGLTHQLISTVVKALLLDRIYGAWWFYLAVGLLLVNTFVCTLTRIPPLVRRGRRTLAFDQEQPGQMPNTASFMSRQPADESVRAIQKILTRRRYDTIQAELKGGHVLSARKGELAYWGSLLFHLSFLIVLVGVVWVQMGRYVGTMIITESQTVTEQRQDYLREGPAPLLGAKHLGFQIRLDKFTPTYDRGNIGTDYAADLAIIDHGREVKRQTVRVNQPLTYRGISFILDLYGFAPLLELKDASGGLLFDGYVNLRVLNPGSVDSFILPDSPLMFRAMFYPDLVTQDGQPASSSLSPNNPALFLEALDGENLAFQGLLPIGDTIQVGGQSLSFTGLNYWTQYRVVRDPGKEVIFAGFWLGLTGLALRYLLTPRRVVAFVTPNLEGSTVTIGGSAPYLESLFVEEFDSLVKEVEEAGANDIV